MQTRIKASTYLHKKERKPKAILKQQKPAIKANDSKHTLKKSKQTQQ